MSAALVQHLIDPVDHGMACEADLRLDDASKGEGPNALCDADEQWVGPQLSELVWAIGDKLPAQAHHKVAEGFPNRAAACCTGQPGKTDLPTLQHIVGYRGCSLVSQQLGLLSPRAMDRPEKRGTFTGGAAPVN